MLSGDRPARLEGNQLLAALFGAQLHFVGCPDHHWGELEIAREQLTAELAADGAGAALDPDRREHGDRRPRLRRRLRRAARAVRRRRHRAARPIVFTSSSGGTHAGLVAGRALLRAAGRDRRRRRCWRSASPRASSPGIPDVAALAARGAGAARRRPTRRSATTTSRSTTAGSATTTPCRRAPATRRSAGRPRHGGWVLDRTYTGKGFAGLLGNAAAGRWRAGDDVVFIHTGGLPAVFAADGLRRHRWRLATARPEHPSSRLTGSRRLGVTSVTCRERDPRSRPAGVRAAATRNQRKAVVDGVRRSLETGFVLHPPRPVRGPARHRLRDAPRVLRGADRGEAALDACPAPTARPGTPACSSRRRRRATRRTGRRCSTGRRRSQPGHPLKRKFPQAYPDQVLPEETVPGITKVLYEFHDTIADLQRRFLRVIAEGIGCHETFFDEMVADGPTLTRAIRYPPMAESPDGDGGHYVWAGRARRHQPDHRPAAGDGARAAGEGRRRVGRRRRPRRPGDHQHRDHARAADQRTDPDRLAPRRRRARLRGRALQRRAVLPSAAVDDPVAGAELLHAGAPAAVPRALRRRRPRRGALPDQPRRRRAGRV